MARGWESKSVEGQVQDFQSKPARKPAKPLTTAQIEACRRREVLLLSRARVLKELEASHNPRYQEQLTRALADLDAQLSQFKDLP